MVWICELQRFGKIVINISNTKEKQGFLGNIYKNNIDKNKYWEYNDYTGSPK